MNIHDLVDIVNNELVNIVDWLNPNKMSLNIEKTHYIIFCNRCKIIGEAGDVLVNGCPYFIRCATTNTLKTIICQTRYPHCGYIFKCNIGLLMYKCHYFMLPPVLDMFVKNCQIHSYNTRQSDLHVPPCRTELGKISFKYQTVMVWNYIYQSVDVNIGIGTFKRHLKSHLLSIILWIIIVSTVCVFPCMSSGFIDQQGMI